MSKNYGKDVSGISYPVVNERGVRAAAGIMFLIGAITMAYVLNTKNFGILYFIVPMFWLDFFLKSVFDPKYSIFGTIGEFLVRRQKPEYVGAIQKRFAWSLGLIMASTMVVIALVMGIKGLAPLTICGTCLALMWMESALGICVGCKIYKSLLDKKILAEPEVRPSCPGGACSIG